MFLPPRGKPQNTLSELHYESEPKTLTALIAKRASHPKLNSTLQCLMDNKPIDVWSRSVMRDFRAS